MRTHHAKTLATAVDRLSAREDALAVVLAGSVARGWASEDSDLDVLLVVNRPSPRPETWAEVEWAVSPCGYVDIKAIDREFLDDVARRGGEPARFAFDGARVEWCSDPVIEEKLALAAQYPEDGAEERLLNQAGRLRAAEWFASESQRRDDPYMRLWTSQQCSYWASRCVLTRARKLFPFHKWLWRQLRECDRPSGFDAGFGSGDPAVARELAQGTLDWLDLSGDDWPERFMIDVEWAWRRGDVEPEDDR